jgi:galactoside O-acetyltransferase
MTRMATPTPTPTPAPSHSVTIFPFARVLNADSITFGAHIIIDDFVFVGRHEAIVIGNHVHLASHCSITGGGRCYLSDFCGISSGARVITGTDDFAGGGLTGPTIPDEFRKVTRGSVVLEAHVVIGANAVILPNVRIGEGAAVGAGAVVTRDLDPWTIYAGVPARPLKPRDPAAIQLAELSLFAKYGTPDRLFRAPPGW